MKDLFKYSLLISKFTFFFCSGIQDHIKFPNIMGDYKIVFKKILQCHVESEYNIQHYYYLHKLSNNTTELRGNLTNKIPLDDSLTFDLNLAVKDTIGSWKDNAHVINSPKACTTLKNIIGTQWKRYLELLGIDDTNCPISKGVYVIANGLNLDEITNRYNIPKQFFYGTFKTRMQLKDKHNKVHGCIIYIIEVKRP